MGIRRGNDSGASRGFCEGSKQFSWEGAGPARDYFGECERRGLQCEESVGKDRREFHGLGCKGFQDAEGNGGYREWQGEDWGEGCER